MAYPFAPVGPDAVGGAEQVLSHLDLALTRLGHRSIVVACAGSAAAGQLVTTALPDGALTEEARRTTHAAHRRSIERVLARQAVDLVHMHGVDFLAYLPPPGVPVLVTLHLPPSWYPPEVFRLMRPDTWLHPVSWSQYRACPPCEALLPPMENGVPVAALDSRLTRRDYAIALGRICPEKNLHQVLDAGTRAGLPVLLGGQLFPYAEHEGYFRTELAPRLAQGHHRFLGPLSFARKRRLLGGARCLVSASLAPETSSLVAMEAMACGTPVIAFPSGALAELVEDGRTGFLVHTVQEMAEAILAAPQIDPEACRESARQRFSVEAMVARYLDAYDQLMLARRAHAAHA